MSGTIHRISREINKTISLMDIEFMREIAPIYKGQDGETALLHFANELEKVLTEISGESSGD